jgi:hypothetical protein
VGNQQREAALRTWADPKVRAKRVRALRISNGKPRTEEHKRKLGLAHVGTKATNSTKQQMSFSHAARFQAMKAEACRMCGSQQHTFQQHQQRVSAARRKSKKWKASILAANARRKNTVARFGQFYFGIDAKVWMRSSWEVKFADWLDRHGIEWQYEPKKFPVGRGAWRGKSYTPDFYLPRWRLWIEIKGWLRKSDEQRLQVFISKYPEVVKNWHMLRFEGLKALGVLK